MKPLRTLEAVQTPDGLLALKQRGERDFLITLDGRVLMTSTAHRSEVVLALVACRRLASHPAPRVLIGGLGMGFTLRGALDVLPASAQVTVAELNPITEAWCRGPLAALTDTAVHDPRVTVQVIDVHQAILRAAEGPPARRFDAIALDLYVGPEASVKQCRRAARALQPGGIFSVWGEAHEPRYVQALEAAGFAVRSERPGQGGLRHVVYIAQLPEPGASPPPPRR
jgi:spermidine synthase